MNKKNIVACLVVTLLLGTLTSCNIMRRGSKGTPQTIDSVVAIAIDTPRALITVDTFFFAKGNMPADRDSIASPVNTLLMDVLTPLYEKEVPFETFNGKAKMHYEGKGDSHEFTAHIRMERDKRIWVSITALGLLEVARALITPDSIQLIDKINKKAIAMPYSERTKLLPAAPDFSALQRLITGAAIITNSTPAYAEDAGSAWRLGLADSIYVQQFSYAKADSSMQQQSIANAGGTALMIRYSNYADHDGRRFPENRVIDITDKGQAILVEMEFSKASFTDAVEFPFSIPANYERK